MVITKYNRGNGKYTIGSQASINSQKSNQTSISTPVSSADNVLWGNKNNGMDDIDETIYCKGSVYAMPQIYDNIEDDEDEEYKEGEIPEKKEPEYKGFEDDEGGNIYAQNLIKSLGDIKADKSIEGNSVYGKTIYLDYPELDNKKEDLKDLLKDHDTRIKTNSNNITNLTTRVGNNETEITNLWASISNIEGDVGNITIPTKLSSFENDCGYITKDDLADADIDSPVILFSGYIYSNNGDTSSSNWRAFYYNGCYNTGVQDLTIEYVNPKTTPTIKIKINNRSGYYIKPYSCSAMVTRTTDYNPTTVTNDQNRRSQGYWCTGGVETDDCIYLNVWRLGDSNNDCTYADQIAWRVTKMNLTIYGKAYKI